MKKLKYMMQRILKMDYGRMWETAKEVHKRTGKNTLLVLIDIIKTGLKYQAGYVDYLDFELYNVPESKRGTFVTRGVNNAYVAKFNSKEKWDTLDNKVNFLKFFDGYHGRGWMDLEASTYEDFDAFLKKYKRIAAKPVDGICGHGIDFYDYEEGMDTRKVFDTLMANQQYLAEEYLIQNKDVSVLHPMSVNTIRVVTIQKDGNIRIPFVCIRVGNGKSVDNLNSGGFAARVNIETGIVETPGVGKYNRVAETHPITGVKFEGFKIPMFDQVIELAKTAALHIPELGIVGWDIAILEDRPVIVEGNQFPGHDIYQSPAFLGPEQIGVKPLFDKLIKELEA
ncbi:hypothetical protein G7062_06140 [Erysipelothrix sp. HDW6C]|uniref:sugar-transfer associated ATP-grasp domain-containing protein n=1 Tax=Erysipelothrix sp. HDW6C TaxID=2714930 RepID=UPI001407904D|nr:sugar-transfer associated ATP-grasp domain-containing protein [Erysipelothrix sp. HDW6C]QIK69896.1 hypothetical protein G7062_06140 [Erysipelothrix sp. HDW6C]